MPCSGFYNHGRVYSRPLPLPNEDREAFERLTERRDTNTILASLDAAPDDALTEESATVETAISAVCEQEYGVAAEDRARDGCAIVLTHDGRLKADAV